MLSCPIDSFFDKYIKECISPPREEETGTLRTRQPTQNETESKRDCPHPLGKSTRQVVPRSGLRVLLTIWYQDDREVI